MNKTKNSGLITLLFSTLVCFGAIAGTNVKEGVYHGSYIVPSGVDLTPVSGFKNDYRVGKDAMGKLTLSYQLPADIVGADPVSIDLTETGNEAGFLLMSGTRNHEASCRVTNDSLVCFVLYPDLVTDTKEIHNLLVQKYPGSPDLLNRDKLAQLFSADPKGVVYCPLK